MNAADICYYLVVFLASAAIGYFIIGPLLFK